VRVLAHIDGAELDALSHRQEFFWLDLVGPSPEDLERLGHRFGWHPLVLEDLLELRQRPKLENYGDYTFVSFYGCRDERDGPRLTEVHLVVSGDYVISVRHAGCRQLDDLRARFERRPPGSEQFVVYRVLDALTDSFFPVLDSIDDELDELEDAIVRSPDERELARVTRLRRLLVELRRVVGPQRDLAARAIEDIVELPGLDPDTRDWFRDLYDHLIRIDDLLDSYRDLLTGVMDIYMSTVSNRLNAVMKQLTLAATVFLPLTFITGFFGQNFGWLVRHISSLTAFLVLGIGGLLVPCALLYAWFRRRGYLGS
jgi:magnesium transporter